VSLYAHRAVLATLLTVSLALAACEDELPGPEPGWMTVTIDSPHGAEGAAMLFVDQPIGQVSQGPLRVFRREVDGGVRLAVMRAIPGGLNFRMQVEDVHQPPTVTLLQVGGPDNELRGDLDGYLVELAR
jgi:hypothetical protein